MKLLRTPAQRPQCLLMDSPRAFTLHATRLGSGAPKGALFSRPHRKKIRDFTPLTPSPTFLSLLPINPASDKPSILLAISVFFGLPIALWAYKCLMLVLFQRKIIYMGYVPPGSRNEGLAEVHPSILNAIKYEEIRIETKNNNCLSGIAVSAQSTAPSDVVVVYFQGNAGNPLHRLPVFQTLLLPRIHPKCLAIPNVKILAVAPRSYWKSTPRRPTQRGILADYATVLSHALSAEPTAKLIVYGHSLGGAAAVCLLAQLRDNAEHTRIRGLVLENPFASIPGMVRALYPQRWLPYHYLAPLAWDTWDALAAMRSHGKSTTMSGSLPITEAGSLLHRLAPEMLVLLSAQDEVVPNAMGEALHQLGGGRLVSIPNALHDTAWRERLWRAEMQRYVADVAKSKQFL